jgi:hypothetical protein
VSGQTWWMWVVICIAAWVAAVFLIAAWLDHDDDLEQYRFPYNDDDNWDGDR